MEKQELKIGQTLWPMRSYFSCPKDKEPQEVVISKIGKKYFEIQGERIYNNPRFHIETLKEHTEGNYAAQCYFTLQEILDKKESDKLCQEIRQFFNQHGKINIALESLRVIKELIE